MKKNILSALALCAVVGLSSCDSFLELEPLDKVSGDKLTETDGGMKALLATVYAAVPMEDFVFRPYTGFNARNYDGVNGASNIAFLSDEAARSEGAYLCRKSDMSTRKRAFESSRCYSYDC